MLSLCTGFLWPAPGTQGTWKKHEFRTRLLCLPGTGMAAKSLPALTPTPRTSMQGAIALEPGTPAFSFSTTPKAAYMLHVPVTELPEVTLPGRLPQAAEVTGTGSVPGGIYSLSPWPRSTHTVPSGAMCPHQNLSSRKGAACHTPSRHTQGSGWEGLTWSIICWRPLAEWTAMSGRSWASWEGDIQCWAHPNQPTME